MKDIATSLIVLVLACGLLYGCGYGLYSLSAAQCRWNWPGYQTQFSAGAGCQVRTPDGWAPEGNVRVNPRKQEVAR